MGAAPRIIIDATSFPIVDFLIADHQTGVLELIAVPQELRDNMLDGDAEAYRADGNEEASATGKDLRGVVRVITPPDRCGVAMGLEVHRPGDGGL